MKLFFVLLSFTVLLRFDLIAQDSYTLGDEELGFSINFPNAPSESSELLYLEDGREMIQRKWSTEMEDSTGLAVEYVLKYTEYPSDYIHSDSSFQLIEGFLNSSAISLDSNINLEFAHVTIGSSNGYLFKSFSYTDVHSNALYEMRVYLIKNKLVEISLLLDENNWFHELKADLFDSLKLIGIKENDAEYGLTIIEKDSYFVDFPSLPQITNRFVDTKEGLVNIRLHIMEREMKLGNSTFISFETKYPNSFAFEDGELDTYYDEAIKGNVRGVNGTLNSKKNITIEALPAVEYEISVFNGEGRVVYRMVLRENQLYSIGVLTTDRNNNQELLDFLDSFKLR